MSIQKVLEMVKKVDFRAGYTIMGDKLIIIVPKNYHDDIKKMRKPIHVIVEELER
jgi:hypothetical protein